MEEIENSKIDGKSKGILLLAGSSGLVKGVTIEVGNPTLGNPGYGLSLDRSSNVIMRQSTIKTSDIAVQIETTDPEKILIIGNTFVIDTPQIEQESRLYSSAGRGDKPPILFFSPQASNNFKGNAIYYVPDSRFDYPQGLTSVLYEEAIANGNTFIQASSSINIR